MVEATQSELTARQRQVLDAIRQFWEDECRPPAVRELMAMLGIRSPNGVVCNLMALAKKGAIEWDREGTARGIWPSGLKDKIRAAVARVKWRR